VSAKAYGEEARRIPVAAECDVIVAGGGSAGIAAAVAASRAGAETILVERYGSLGGMATGGLIILLLSLDDGCGRQTVGGLCQELVDRLTARSAALHPPAEQWGNPDPELVEYYRRYGLVWGREPHAVRYSVAYDPEEFRFAANELLAEAGVRLRLHTWIARPIVADGAVQGVITESKAGREAFLAKVVVDATGDGDLFAAAGEPFGLEPVHPWLWFRMGNVRGADDAILGTEGRFFKTLGGRFFKTLGAGRTLMPWGIADVVDRKIDPTSPDDLTWAELECRRRVMAVVDELKGVEGFEDAYLEDLAWQLGIYESRRLEGRYVLGRRDEGVSFHDAVAFTGDWVRYGVTYEIPYRCLLPQRTEQLLVAGRCLSADHRVHQATKEIPPCFATGEAAGIAAALSAATGVATSSLDVGEIRAQLLKAGAILGPNHDSRSSDGGGSDAG
jgi:glycine/D-amino acid oxidase-like deaminating enzyme